MPRSSCNWIPRGVRLTDRTAGAVLVGGRSRRMGADKATIRVGGRTLAERALAALDGAGCAPVVLVGGDPRLAAALHRGFVADAADGIGPLGGVAAALGAARTASCAHVAVLATDLPAITASAVASLVAAAGPDVDVVVARTDRREPLVSVWSVAAAPVVDAAIAAGTRAVRDVFDELRCVDVPVDAATLHNANTPDDLAGFPEPPA